MSMPEVPELARLLEETEERHGQFEAVAPRHKWSDWYAAYLHSRLEGTPPSQSAAAADKYVSELLGIAVPARESSDG